MSPIQAALWVFLKERFARKESAAPRPTILTGFNRVRLVEFSDRDFRDAVSSL
jgi:hypothetical protein